MISLKKLFLSIFVSFFCVKGNLYASEVKVSAFLRVKDEIKTIEACLESIKGVFDRIVIIHSNEKDDGSVAFMHKWCLKNKSAHCEIYEYPYDVIPSHSGKYSRKYNYENTLAAYNNFGLKYFDAEEWVVKIDADQVYLKEELQKVVSKIKLENPDNTKYSLIGYNTFKWHDYLVKYKPTPFNGQNGDSYFVKRKNIDGFKHAGLYEITHYKNLKNKVKWQTPVWFHFMKNLKTSGYIRDNNSVAKDSVLFLSSEEKQLFNNKIRPFLKNSEYYHIKLDEE